MIDWAEQIESQRLLQERADAATASGNVVTITVIDGEYQPGSVYVTIDANIPVTIRYRDQSAAGMKGEGVIAQLMPEGGAVFGCFAEDGCEMIEDLAKQGVAEIRSNPDGNGNALVIEIPPYTEPEA